jgi:hypothetical protein
MGAVAIRTYAAAWIAAGGKYSCADLDDTTASQVYKDEFVAKTNVAVDATKGAFIVKDGALVFAEYSAENSDPTAFGVLEPYCTGRALNGHGRGTCQWGTQRWAKNEGRDEAWMAPHYYPGAELALVALPYEAVNAGESYASTMTSGDEATVTVDFTNSGTATWDATTQLATSEPRDRVSPFAAGSWLSPNRPAAIATPGVAPGAVGHFTFVLKAPAVEAPTTFVEHFGLVHEGQTWFATEDSLVTWTITVNPKKPAPGPADTGPTPPPDAANHPAEGGGGGCQIGPTLHRRGGGNTRGNLTRTAAMLLLAVAAWKRGRQLVIVGVAND